MADLELLLTIPCANTLGEGVQWNPQDGCIWWADLLESRLYRFHYVSEELTHWTLPERIGCFAFAKHDKRILIALASGFAWFDVATNEIEWIAKPEAHIVGNRSNDGRCDRQGRFWMGSTVDVRHHEQQCASLYCLDKDFSVSQHLSNLRISNSLCWSPDSKTAYHADSPTNILHAYDFDPQTGRLNNQRIFAQLEHGVEPDGACVDAEGFVWNAQWGASRVRRYSPQGALDFELSMPVSQATCVAFGGERLDLLCVTSARIGLNEDQLAQQPLAGNLFIFKTPYRGLEECRFGG